MFLTAYLDDVCYLYLDDDLDCRVGVTTNREDDIIKAKEIDGDEFSESCYCVIAVVDKELNTNAEHLSYISNEGDIRELRKLTDEEINQVNECIKRNHEWIIEEFKKKGDF